MVEFPINCPHEDCKKSKKKFKGFTGIRTHYSLKHGKSILLKDLEEILRMSTDKEEKVQEQPTIKQEVVNNEPTKQSGDVSSLIDKVDKLVNMIPPDLCEQFPNLCKLPGQVGKLQERVNQFEASISDSNKSSNNVTETLKGIGKEIEEVKVKLNKVPTKIVLKTNPKQEKEEKKVEEEPKETVEKGSEVNEVVESVNNLGTKIDSLLADMKQAQQPKEQPKDNHDHDHDHEKKKVEGHKTAQDLLSCPGCREKLINGMMKEIQENSPIGEVLKNSFTKILSTGKEVNSNSGKEESKQKESSGDIQSNGREESKPDNGGTEPEPSTNTSTEQGKPDEVQRAGTEEGLEAEPKNNEPESGSEPVIEKPKKCHFFLRR